MEYLIGVGLAVVVCAFARLTGFDREPSLLSDAADSDCHVLHFVCRHGEFHAGAGAGATDSGRFSRADRWPAVSLPCC